MGQWLERYFNQLWYEPGWQKWLYWPLSAAAEKVVTRKRARYLAHPPQPLPVPVVVIGNLTVGGTGKTPLIIHLVEAFRTRGLKVGVVSRGYGGRARYPLLVTPDTDPAASGDEPAMIVRRTGVPLAVDPDRARGARALLAHTPVDVLLSDDGLQHYRLPRSLEVLVVDGKRGFGNGRLLPMGPLREPVERLDSLRFVVVNGATSPSLAEVLSQYPQLRVHEMAIVPGAWKRLAGHKKIPGEDPAAPPADAIAGIGNPSRFFDTLRQLGVRFNPRIFPDHHRFSREDLHEYRENEVVMTEKDAVKIQPSWLTEAWYLPVDAAINSSLADDILRALDF